MHIFDTNFEVILAKTILIYNANGIKINFSFHLLIHLHMFACFTAKLEFISDQLYEVSVYRFEFGCSHWNPNLNKIENVFTPCHFHIVQKLLKLY